MQKSLILLILFPILALAGSSPELEQIIAQEIGDINHDKIVYEYNLPQKLPEKIAFRVSSLSRKSQLAYIEIIDKDSGKIFSTISARYQLLSEIPVFNKIMRKGDVISEKDITYESLDSRNITSRIITQKSTLINKSITKRISAFTPINESDIDKPVLIAKKSMINVIYKKGAVEVKMLAVAMEDGKEGEMIKIKNPKSNAVILGRVISSNEVSIVTD